VSAADVVYSPLVQQLTDVPVPVVETEDTEETSSSEAVEDDSALSDTNI
jgi:hypothetical protein